MKKRRTTNSANALIHETSPYLRMHAHNPVNWYPWGEEALEKARVENKPILLSIGYTACHWCHVMAKESFEDEDTAALMNENFINIKVDREERPDLDKIYQLSHQIFLQRGGGWPLTIFLTPDQRLPFFVGTYFPDEPRGGLPAFKIILEYVAYFFKHHQSEINQQNNSLQKIFDLIDQQNKTTVSSIDPSGTELLNQRLLNIYDEQNGGFGLAPKFPMPSYLQYTLVKYANFKKLVDKSLTAMAQGGLNDHIEGGFFRYCIDEKWSIPHFEKMLYDNAQLLSLYTEAYLLTGESLYKNTAIQTGLWTVNTLQSKEGGFYATLSAESDEGEGRYYLWTKNEIQALLSKEELPLIEKLYGLDLPPNFEHQWHLGINKSYEEISSETGLPAPIIEKKINEAKKKLLLQRKKRRLPEIDNKIIVSWNSLNIRALLMAGYYLDQPILIDSAEKALQFIKNNMWRNEQLYSCYTQNKPHILGFLDDYAFLIYALLYALQVKWNSQYLFFAIALIKKMISNFYDIEHGGFYFTDKNSEELLLRIKQHQDEALPSSNALATYCLMFYGFLLGETTYLDMAEASLKNAFKQMQETPEAHCSFFNTLNLFFNKPEIIIVRVSREKLLEWQEVSKKYYHPFRMVFLIPNDETNLPQNLLHKTGYCHGFECLNSITSLQDFEHVLQHRPLARI